MIRFAGLVITLLVLTSETKGNVEQDTVCPLTAETELPFDVICKTKDYWVVKTNDWTLASTVVKAQDINNALDKLSKLTDYYNGNNKENITMNMAPPLVMIMPEGNLYNDMSVVLVYSGLQDGYWPNSPHPNDPDVTIEKLPKLNLYITCYSGFASFEDHSEREEIFSFLFYEAGISTKEDWTGVAFFGSVANDYVVIAKAAVGEPVCKN